MNYPALNPNRSVVFDPCVTSGAKLLTEVSNATSELLGLAHGPVRGDGIKLIRNASLGDTFQMLGRVTARFDLIVSAPPAGTIPSKGLPKPMKIGEVAKPTVRRILHNRPADAPAPEIDHGYAVFLATNALLSPFGEAMLIVSGASFSLIEKDVQFSRVWRVYAETLDSIVLYVAKDHRQPPGTKPTFGVAHPVNRGELRGEVINAHNRTPDTYQKFVAVREEILRQNTTDLTDDFNIRLDNERIRLRFTDFQTVSGAIPRSLVDEAETLLRNKSLLELAVMRDTRDQARRILTDKRLKVPPGVIAAFNEVCAQLAIQSAPFNRPSPVQRVAWLDEQNTIECLREWAGFRVGESYQLQTRVITGKKLEKRHRPGHGQEEVLVTGQELVVAVFNHHVNVWSIFTQYQPSDETRMEIANHFSGPSTNYHLLADLITSFKMPEVQDIAEADPALYMKFRKRLEALQTT